MLLELIQVYSKIFGKDEMASSNKKNKTTFFKLSSKKLLR
jgi:hypothetical protein